MSEINLDHLIMKENAYFYFQTKQITKTKIVELFRAVSVQKIGNYKLNVVKEKVKVGSSSLTYSACVFKYKATPSFLESESELEIKYSYLLIAEYKGYVVISKKGISGLHRLMNTFISGLDYQLISRLFINDETFFEKFSMINMDISDNVIRRKNIEAADLRGSFAPFGASKYVLNSLRISADAGRLSLSFNTSRINRLGSNVRVDDFFKWLIEVIDRIISHTSSATYLDHFASPLSFESHIHALHPRSILFVFDQLMEDLDNGRIVATKYMISLKGKDIFREFDLAKHLDSIEWLCEIEKESHNTYKVRNQPDATMRLKVNKSSITVLSRMLKHIVLILNDNEELSLGAYMNREQNFIISFNDIETIYWGKKLFKDSALLGNLQYFLNVFQPHTGLNLVSSEKGNTTGKTRTYFDTNSIFYFIESQLVSDAEYVICDDLATEWADYIAIAKSKRVALYHAKHSTVGLSAKNFHEVVSQAQKNLGNVFASDAQLKRRESKWASWYASTKISRVRKGSDVKSATAAYHDTLSSPNARKEVHLVVSFISKSSLESALGELKAGKSINESVTHILWLISSLVLSCKEANTDIYVHCLP